MRILTALLIFSLNSAFALVDYSPSPKRASNHSGPKIDISNLRSSSQSTSTTFQRGNAVSKMFFFSTGFSSVDGNDIKFSRYNLGVTLMTPWKVYFDLDMNYGGSNTEGGSFSMGNTEFSIGATWLEFGNSFDLITMDIIGGMSLGVKDSEIGSQRSDSYVGFLSKKNFGNIDISLGFEHWFMDDEAYDGERAVGSYNKYIINSGWTVSSDIRFDLGIQFINLGEISALEDISYTELTPQLGLRLGRGLNLTLGARFSSDKKVEKDALNSLKVWNISSLYGNSYFSKLAFNF